jgi:hypothetical protein
MEKTTTVTKHQKIKKRRQEIKSNRNNAGNGTKGPPPARFELYFFTRSDSPRP